MEVSMEDAAPEQQQQQQHKPDPLQQQQQQQQQLQHQAERIQHTIRAQHQAHAAVIQQSTAVLQQPPEHPHQRTSDSQQQQQQQEQQQGAPRSIKGSKYKQRPEDEGPDADKWWLSESEGEGDEDDEQQLLKSEDPLYDPEADDADEAWAEEQRSGRTTDAILSCPGCFTTLCIDCQQHEVYHTQYRAMFTQNCEVKLDEVMQTQVQRQRQQQRGRKRRADAAAPQGLEAGEGDVLHPVCCAVCGTQVGAQDADEIVHFFQVLASEC